MDRTALSETLETAIISRLLSDPPRTYEHYAPAVRLGNSLAILEENHNKRWEEIEPAARRLWQIEHERPWQEFRDVVREAWAETQPEFSSEPTDPAIVEQSYAVAFRRHFADHYRQPLSEFGELEPAYALGYDLAVDQQLEKASWGDLENAVSQYWEANNHPQHWNAAQEAVYFAWKEVRERNQLVDAPETRRSDTIKTSDVIDESALESFPASDPPAWNNSRNIT
jgi:hypothetical protein